MIELISDARCIDCNLCVKICPTNVFDARPGAPPVLARAGDCQTCFMCELYCPTDALYVNPMALPAAETEVVGEAALEAGDVMGSYVRKMGWRRAKPGGTANDPTFRFRGMLRGGT